MEIIQPSFIRKNKIFFLEITSEEVGGSSSKLRYLISEDSTLEKTGCQLEFIRARMGSCQTKECAWCNQQLECSKNDSWSTTVLDALVIMLATLLIYAYIGTAKSFSIKNTYQFISESVNTFNHFPGTKI